ncbi:MAG TPA: histone deacetylase [Planctomycetes bacterium]|nr:histone deacetylase [Planctomycetota bacterium]
MSASAAGENAGADARAVGFVYHEVYKKHLTGYGHPERPERLDAINAALARAGLDKETVALDAPLVDDDYLLACHTPAYVALVEEDIARGAGELSTGDTSVCAASLAAARRAAGGVRAAVDFVCGGKGRRAFCAVRPPGHHATASAGMGFCIFNNVALGARYALRAHKLARALIVDWDIHHGNGTQDIFYEDGSVFYFSTHRRPWYPGTGAPGETGAGKGKGMILNKPFGAGAGRAEILGAFTDALVPAMREFKPEIVFISAGFDSRIDDPLGGFTLTDEDFADLTRVVLEIADAHAGGRVVSALEGGYGLEGLGLAVAAHVGAMVRWKG